MMKYEILKKKPAIFLSLFGVKVTEFERIREKVAPRWATEIIGKYSGPGRFFKRPLEEMILLLLLYYRHYITQEFVGMLFGLHKSNVCRIIKRLEPILLRIMPLPQRDKLSPEEIQDLIIDATENQIERPKYEQEKYYSGKKKRHTLKTEIRVTKKGRIMHVSDTVHGTVHDFKLWKDSQQIPSEKIPPETHVLADSGYQGIQDIHKDSEIPKKKPKNGELTKDEKDRNTALSKVRVIVENILGDIKVFRIMSDRYRNKRIKFNEKFRIIVGIVNLKNGFGLA
jgi:hypothetical protein